MKELGVGLVYFQGFEKFLVSHSSLIDVLEIEPQTFWYDKNDECDAFKYDTSVSDFLAAYEKPKLFHGVGYPIGGTILPPVAHFNTLREQAAQLNPQWISEHLSYNMFSDNRREVNAGFLLPPLQSKESVELAANNIRYYRAQMNDRPFAFETGVNYLKPRKNEIPDGLFTARIAEEADCNILLDLHNILANQRNGRQSVKDFLASLPFERIVELHVGGGIYYNNYYLDAHSGPMDEELHRILEDVVKRLPNLKALMFEITPDYFKKVPEVEIRNQLVKMRRIWDKRGQDLKSQEPGVKNQAEQISCRSNQRFDETISVKEWERMLGRLILNNNTDGPLAGELVKDKGVDIIKDLVFNFRGSVLISALKLTTRLLRLTLGEALFNRIVADFFYRVSPQLLPVVMVEQFAEYLKLNGISVHGMDKILEYEIASIHTAIDKQTRVVSFGFDPFPVFSALQNAQLPGMLSTGKTVNLHVVFDQPAKVSELINFTPVFHK